MRFYKINGTEYPKAIGVRFTGYDDEAYFSFFISYWFGYIGVEWR